MLSIFNILEFVVIIIAILIFVYLLRVPITGGASSAADRPPDRRAREYQRWLAVQDMTRAVPSYEGLNILERWLVACANERGQGDAILKPSETADTEFKRELSLKKIAGDPLARITSIRERYLRGGYARYVPDGTPLIADGEVRYGRFRFPVKPERLAIMREVADDNAITVCALRYGCLLGRGQQWAAPLRVYGAMPPETVEGFASPFNSQNFMLRRAFCSLFPDTDGPFGSLGGFFDTDLSDRPLLINPPFIPLLLERAARVVVARPAGAPPVSFIGPDWDNGPHGVVLAGWQSVRLESGTYGYESGDKEIVARFPSRLWSTTDPAPLSAVWLKLK